MEMNMEMDMDVEMEIEMEIEIEIEIEIVHRHRDRDRHRHGSCYREAHRLKHARRQIPAMASGSALTSKQTDKLTNTQT